MPAYSGGTVWLQVVPSFNGLQGAIRKGVSGAFAGAGIDRAATKAFSEVDKQASAAGERAARQFAGSFEKETSDRVKRMTKDFAVLREEAGLSNKEFKQIRAVLKDLGK